jgi:membrane protein implicated in regulation of membrane protease activity
MNPESKAVRRAEVVDEISKWTVGFGVITVALFGLSLPILLLTAVALLPLAVPLIAIGLVAAVVAVPILLVRRLVRGIRSRTRGGRTSRAIATTKGADAA